MELLQYQDREISKEITSTLHMAGEKLDVRFFLYPVNAMVFIDKIIKGVHVDISIESI